MRDENRDYGHGRLWRLTRNGAPLLEAPTIAGAPVGALLELLTHDQVRVRELARVELGLHPTAEVVAAMKGWLPSTDDDSPAAGRKRLEALWVYERRGIDDPTVLREMLASGLPQVRAAGARSLRHWGDVLGKEAFGLAKKALADKEPRVRVGAISSISFLQWDDPDWHTVLLEHEEAERSVPASVLARAKAPPEPLMKPVVPILAALEDSRLKGWTIDGDRGTIWFNASRAIDVRIGSRRNASIQISVNDLPVIEGTGNTFSQDFQAPAKVHKGVNKIEYTIPAADPKPRKGKKPKPTRVEVYLSDLQGQKPRGVSYPNTPEEAAGWSAEYDADYAIVGEDHIYLKAVPGRLQFNATELEVEAGKTYRFTFENPDVIMHNFILTKPGGANEVGQLATALAATPDGLKKHYIPDSDLVLFATEQVPGGNTLRVSFTAPARPGIYPYICTFPGHWQIMRGQMVVE